MKSRCKNCSHNYQNGDKFCEGCGQPLFGESSAIGKRSFKNRKWLVVTLAVIAIICMAYYMGSQRASGAIKGDWIIQENEEKVIKLSIASEDKIVFNYLEADSDATISIDFALEQPASLNDPYYVKNPQKAEIKIPLQYMEEAGGIDYFEELGFEVKKSKDYYAVYSEKSEVINDFIDLGNNIYFYEVDGSLEMLYTEASTIEFVLAVPEEDNNNRSEDYIERFQDVLYELRVSDIDRKSEAKAELLEIRKIQPKSKLLALYTDLNVLNEDYLLAMDNQDTEKLIQISDEIGELSLSHIGGLYEDYLSKNESFVSLMSNLNQLENALSEAKKAFDEGDYQSAEDYLNIDEEIVRTVKLYFSDTILDYETLQDNIDKELHNNITFDDFKGYWTTFSADTPEEETYGKTVFYLSDEFSATAINHGEMVIGSVVDHEVIDNVITITKQPLHGQEPDDFEQVTFELMLEKTSEGKKLTFKDYPESIYYYQEREGDFTESYELFEEKGHEFFSSYKKKQDQLAEIEANPAGYFLGKSYTEITSDSTIKHSYREKDLSTDGAGIGEYWYSRETVTEGGEVQARGLQFLIHDITYEDEIFTILVSDYIYLEGDSLSSFHYKYLDDNLLGAYNPETNEITGIFTLK